MAAILPEHFKRDMMHNVQLIAQSALSSPDIDRVYMLAEELRSVFCESIVVMLRTYNIRHSLQPRLPNELWCLLWSYLPLDDILAISRVCHSWRLLALASPGLWCTLDFCSSAHADGCDCSDCNEGYVGTSNIDETVALLPRSGATLPLTLDIRLEAPYANFDAIEVLAEGLLPHSHRIAALEFRADSSAVTDFFSRFDAFPMLRSFVVKLVNDPYARSGSPLVPSGDNKGRTLLLPSLERMDTLCGIGTLPLFPATLTSLACPFIWADDVFAYLEQVPNLKRLELLLRPFFRGHHNAEDFARLKQACIRIPSVTLLDIPRSDSHYTSTLLGTEYQELRFSYQSTFDGDDGFQILSTIREPTCFSICQKPRAQGFYDLEIAVGDAGSRIRSVTFYAGERRELITRWQMPLTRQLPEALVDLALLPWVTPTLAAGVTALIINVFLTDRPPSVPDGVPVFAALETIEFRLLGPAPYFSSDIIRCAPTDDEVSEIRYIAESLLPQPEREMVTNVSVTEDNGVWIVYIERSTTVVEER